MSPVRPSSTPPPPLPHTLLPYRLGGHALEPATELNQYSTQKLGGKSAIGNRGKNSRVRKREDLSGASERKAFTVTTVALSACGNFGLVGDSRGVVHKFNMQSGQARGTYPAVRSNNAKWNAVEVARLRKKARKEAAEKGGRGARGAAAFGTEDGAEDEVLRKQLSLLKPGAHSGPLSSVATDATNERMLSTGLDGVLAVWDFRSHRLLHAVHLGSPIAQAILQRESGLLAAACDDFVVRLYDANISDAGSAVSTVRTGKRKKNAAPAAPRAHVCRAHGQGDGHGHDAGRALAADVVDGRHRARVGRAYGGVRRLVPV